MREECDSAWECTRTVDRSSCIACLCTTTSLLLAVLTPTEYAVRVRVGGVH